MPSEKPSGSQRGIILVAVGFLIGAVIPGIIGADFERTSATDLVKHAITVLGMIGYCSGLAMLARSKGRAGWWGLTGLLCWIGGISVAFLPRRNSAPPPLPSADV